MKAILIDAKYKIVLEIDVPKRDSAFVLLKVQHKFQTGDVMLSSGRQEGTLGFKFGSDRFRFKTIYGSAIILSKTREGFSSAKKDSSDIDYLIRFFKSS